METFNKLSMAGKVVLGGTIAFLIVSIFNWQEVDVGVAEAGRSMWAGWGTLAGILAIAILAWEVLRLANVNVNLPISATMATAILAILLALATILKVLVDNEFRTFWAWLGLLLALVIAAAAFMRMQEGGESFADMRRSVSSAASGAASRTRTAVDRGDTPPSTSTTDDTSDDRTT
ncbi:MAG TPA: hypothetical protein VFU26_13625 [Gaiellaceae bacterium]|nr:hypothetical protein [Gaiellaceae bacterium]